MGLRCFDHAVETGFDVAVRAVNETRHRQIRWASMRDARRDHLPDWKKICAGLMPEPDEQVGLLTPIFALAERPLKPNGTAVANGRRPAQFSRKLFVMEMYNGLNIYRRNVCSPLRIITSAGIPGTSWTSSNFLRDSGSTSTFARKYEFRE